MIRLTRRYRFAASHRLHSEELNAERNRELYGKCNNPFGHGHNYVVDVRIRGPVDAESGRAVDIETLDALVRSEVLDAFDRRNLNREVAAFRDVVPTSENLSVEILRRLRSGWGKFFPQGGPALESVRIAETDRNIFELSNETK